MMLTHSILTIHSWDDDDADYDADADADASDADAFNPHHSFPG